MILKAVVLKAAVSWPAVTVFTHRPSLDSDLSLMSIHILTAFVGPFEAQKQPVLWERKHKLHEKKIKK